MRFTCCLCRRPEFREPLVRLLGLIRICDGPVELGNGIAGQIVQSVLLVRAGANRVGHSLDVVTDFLVHHEPDVLDLAVLDAVLVAEVGVDDAHAGSVDGNHVLDRHVALGLVEAVAARLVEGAEGLGVEAGDVELASEGVVLEDLVLCVAGSAADDAQLRVEALGGQRVFADVFPPD